MAKSRGPEPADQTVLVYESRQEGCGALRIARINPDKLPEGGVRDFISELLVQGLPLFQGVQDDEELGNEFIS